MRPESRIGGWLALALVPMVFASAGAALDEYWRLGFSTWRSACRAAGFSPASLVSFTLELLPSAVIGALLGGIAVQIIGLCLRHRAALARASLAAHGGCAVAMTAALPLCALSLPLPFVLAAEATLAVACAALLFRLLRNKASCGASVIVPTRTLPSA